MKLSRLYLKDTLTLIGLFLVGFGWVLIDQYFIQEAYIRIIAFTVIAFALYWLQFIINKPYRKEVRPYTNTIALITVSFVVITSLVMHVLINHDFAYQSILIWIISATLPYIAGYIYTKQLTHNNFKHLELHSRD